MLVNRYGSGLLFATTAALILGLFGGCTFSLSTVNVISFLRPDAGNRGEPPLRLRLLQLKKRFDSPQTLNAGMFGDLAGENPPLLTDLLSADRDDPQKHVEAVYTVNIPLGSTDKTISFPRLKDGNFLIAVALPHPSARTLGTSWIDQWDYPHRYKIWRQSVRVCVDNYDVYIECEFYTIRVYAGGQPRRLKLRAIPLREEKPLLRAGWRELLHEVPQSLVSLLADGRDAGRGNIDHLQTGEALTIHHRLPPGTRSVLLAVADEAETWGATDVQPLQEEGGESTVFLDLGRLR